MTQEHIIAEREIYRGLVRFARAMDEKNWTAFDSITTADITADLGTGLLAGRVALVEQFRTFLDSCGPTQHLLGNVLIDVEGGRASSKAYVSDMHQGAGDKAELTFCTLSDYHDEWRKVDGVWLMHHRTKHIRGTIGSLDVFGSFQSR